MTVNANTKIYDKTLDRSAMIRLYEKRVNNKVELSINGHAVRLDKLIRDAELSQKGFETLREAVDQELQKTYTDIYSDTKRSLLDLAVDQLSYTYQNIETAMGNIWKTERPQRRVAEELVLKKPLYNNMTLEAGWHGIHINEKKRLESLIRKGIAENKSVDQIALEVRKGNIHKITRGQSKALVVTAITSVHTQADHEVYKANEKAIEGWQYVAVLDSRTTPLCAHRDGTIYPISDTSHLPPAHFHCRSTTVPVFKNWEDISKLEGVAQVRKRNIAKLTKDQVAFYDGQTPLRESYNDWLLRQPQDVQLRHLGDYKKVELFQSGELTIDKFSTDDGRSVGIKELRSLTQPTAINDTKRFANAKAKLDAMQLGINTPDDLIDDVKLQNTLRDYYLLQSGELDGSLSLTNYRGALLHTKKATKQRVLTSPPTEEQLKFNPITGRYEDIRMYQPAPEILANSLRLIDESDVLLERDKVFLNNFEKQLTDKMGVNEKAVVIDNLRILFTRYRKNPEVWSNFKAVSQAQIKFDIMNISDSLETFIRKDSDVLKKLLKDNYIDPVLGPTQLSTLHDEFIDNILKKNKWEDTVSPKIARELRTTFDKVLLSEPILWKRLGDHELKQFYLRFAHRLSLADSPDLDQFAVALGRDLFNAANLNGSRNEWFRVGNKILQSKNVNKFFELETFGVQKRRMKSRMSGQYFGPYYDTLSYNIRVTDPRIQEYAQLTRKVDLGLRVSVLDERNKLIIRKNSKTYWIDRGILGYEDTRIPITSTSSFSDFPEEFIDDNLVNALNWASSARYKIDPDFYDFVKKLIYFEDDKGKAKYFNDLNEFKKHIASRGDSYERFKAMEWLRKDDKAFSNNPFIDHRARIYERGLIGPQSGETFRPFLNTEELKNFSVEDFYNLQDQIGAFVGGLSDNLEGNYNSLTITGRQKIANKLRPDLVDIGNHMLRGKPADIRYILEHPIVAEIDGEDIGKFFRLAMESAKIDKYLGGSYTKESLVTLKDYKTALALEQDASSSGAQIIALTTRNKQLAEMSNVVPTNYKKRLYDEIAAATFNDPRFIELNQKLGLTEKDLRKAAKA